MAKHRKTRKEKELADSRHNFTHKFVSSAPFEVKFDAPKKLKSAGESGAQTHSVSVGVYSYLVKDLSKTAALTLAILAFQIVLFSLLKHHLFVIPGLNY